MVTKEANAKQLQKLAAWTKKQSPEYMAYLYLRKKARKKGIAFNLEPSDITFPDVCPILGIPIKQGFGPLARNSPSVDRVDNTKGYVKGNIQIISVKANSMKNDATPEELKRFADWVNHSTL